MEKRLAADWGLSIDPVLRDFLDRDDEAVKELEGLIVKEGCREALTVWKEKNCVVDGNTRYDICKANGIPFAVEYMSFASRSEAMRWAWHNQKGRRNMNKPQLIDAAHKIEDEIRAEAKERMLAGKKQDPTPNLAEGSKGESRDKLADMAGVGHTTYQKGTHILDNAPEPIKKAWKSEALTTEAAYQATKLPEEAQKKIEEGLERGEKKPKEVVREVINEYKKEDKMEAATIPVME